mmetsp:Transcript_52084/g.160446  ORF Transcript_52084/g.160446 Transcript_52084/m.160446 type:complete len:232 (-) Transcript_52084:301-996(-)
MPRMKATGTSGAISARACATPVSSMSETHGTSSGCLPTSVPTASRHHASIGSDGSIRFAVVVVAHCAKNVGRVGVVQLLTVVGFPRVAVHHASACSIIAAGIGGATYVAVAADTLSASDVFSAKRHCPIVLFCPEHRRTAHSSATGNDDVCSPWHMPHMIFAVLDVTHVEPRLSIVASSLSVHAPRVMGLAKGPPMTAEAPAVPGHRMYSRLSSVTSACTHSAAATAPIPE